MSYSFVVVVSLRKGRVGALAGAAAVVLLACGSRSSLEVSLGPGVSVGGSKAGGAGSGGGPLASGGSMPSTGGGGATGGAGATGGSAPAPSGCEEPGGMLPTATFDGMPVYRLPCTQDKFEVESALSQSGDLALVYAGSSSGLTRFRWIDAEWSQQRVDERGIDAIDSVWVDSYWDQSLVTFGVSAAPNDLMWIEVDPGSNSLPSGSGTVSRGIQSRTIRTGSMERPVRRTHTTRSGQTTAVFGDTGNVTAWQDEQRWIETIGVGPALATVDFTDEVFASLVVDNQGNLRSRFADQDSLSEQLVQAVDPAITAYVPAEVALAEDADIAYASWTGESALGKVGFVAQWRSRTWTTFNVGLVTERAPRVAVNTAGDAVMAWASCGDERCVKSGVEVSLWARDGELRSALSDAILRCSEVGAPAVSADAQTWVVPMICGAQVFVAYSSEGGVRMPVVPSFDHGRVGVPEVVLTPDGSAGLVVWGAFDSPDANTNIRPISLYSALMHFDGSP